MNILKTGLLATAMIGFGMAATLAQEASASNMNKVTVINTIAVAKDKQDTVAGLQLELVDKIKKSWPGFISQRTLKSADGDKVTTIEEYTDMDSLKAIAADPGLVEYREKIKAAGGQMAPVVYSTAGETAVAR